MILQAHQWFQSISNQDAIGVATVAIYFSLLWVGYWQLKAFNKTKRIEFTYKVDEDLVNVLHHKDNIRAKAWLMHNKPLDLDNPKHEDQLTALLDEFEGIYTLMKKGEIDEDVFYDMLSYYLELLTDSTKTPTFKYYFDICNEDAKSKGLRPDVYTGIPKLLKRVEIIQRRRDLKDKMAYLKDCIFAIWK